ncbi:MAG: CotH kinase family protein [Clostridia bacterium]|nr:CotH kinase family protein [Clostridia bacterium]
MRYRKLKTVFFAVLLALVFACTPLLSACNETTGGNVTITYETGVEGLTVNSFTAKAGSRIYPPADPEREGYRFEYWELNGQQFVFDKMPDKDITLTAKWLKLYWLSFVTGDDAEKVDGAYYAAGDALELPDDVLRQGFKLTGWTVDGVPFTSQTMPEKDLTLTASWAKAYTITFAGTKGLTVAPIVEVAGAPITAPAVNKPGEYVKYWKLNGEKFNFDVMSDKDITLTAEWETLTNLPAMFIDLNNGYPLSAVNRKDYVESKVSVTNTTDDAHLLHSIAAGFRGRGNGSWTDSGDKKGYKIKFDKKQSLFGRAANKHWVVIACANFDDVTMYRNYLAYNMAGEVFSDIEYSTCAYWLDLYVNGEYRGVYLLCEHVRVGSGRVDIESEYTTEPEHNGFLVEYDAYGDVENADKGEVNLREGINYFRVEGLKYPFTVKSPDPEDYEAEGVSMGDYMEQVAYIKDYVTKVYKAALAGNYDTFKELADANSFIDMYILHELFKNMDTGYSSFYLYKKPDGKLYAGPPWDFDASTNADDGNGRGDRTAQGLYIAKPDTTSSPEHTRSELYISLYQIPAFRSAVKTRWKQLSPQITSFLNKQMNDDVYAANRVAMGKNFAMWKGTSQSVAETTWINNCKTLKKWFTDRIAWLNTEWA